MKVSHIAVVAVLGLGFGLPASHAEAADFWDQLKAELCFYCSNTSQARNASLTALAAHSAEEKMLVTLVVQETRKFVLSDEHTSLDNSFASLVKTTVNNQLFGSTVEMVVPAKVVLGVDLSGLKPGNVTATNSGLTIQLPPITAISVEIDLQNSKLMSKAGLLLSKEQEIDGLAVAIDKYKDELRRQVLANDKYVERAKAGAEKAIKDILEPHLSGVKIHFTS